MAGTVVGIFTATGKGEGIVARDEVVAVAGRGLEGDRYYESNHGDHDPAKEITLIELEGLRVAADEHDVTLDPGEHRRNVVVEGLGLVGLVGETITVGGAEVEVVADNPPCKYLQTLIGKPVVLALRRKGGVRGRIAKGGTIRLGDPVA